MSLYINTYYYNFVSTGIMSPSVLTLNAVVNRFQRFFAEKKSAGIVDNRLKRVLLVIKML